MIPKLFAKDQPQPAPRVPSYAPQQAPRQARPAPQPVPRPAPQQAPTDFERVAARLTKANVTARQIEHYMKSGRFKSPEHAGAAVATDNIWADEAKTAGALTGDPLQDKLVWEKHWQFNRGRVASDPLLDLNPRAQEQIAERVTQVIKEMEMARQSETRRVPTLRR